MRPKIKMTRREALYWLSSFIVGAINLRHFHTNNIFLNMAIRLPQIYVLGVVYKNYIKQGKMKTNVQRYRFKNRFLHFAAFISGYLVLIAVVFASHYFHINPEPSLEFTVSSYDVIGSTGIRELMWVFPLALFIFSFWMYAFLQTVFYIREMTVWTYNHKPRIFPLVLCTEEVFSVMLVSLFL